MSKETISRSLYRLTILEKKECDRLISWCNRQDFSQEFYFGKPTSRREKWWGLKVELYGTDKSRVAESISIDSDKNLRGLRDRFYPDANSVLLYSYAKGSSIGEHCDKPIFDRKVVIVNLIDADRDLFGDKPVCKFKFAGNNYLLQDGEVFEFDSFIAHAVPVVRHQRYSLQFRKVL